MRVWHIKEAPCKNISPLPTRRQADSITAQCTARAERNSLRDHTNFSLMQLSAIVTVVLVRHCKFMPHRTHL